PRPTQREEDTGQKSPCALRLLSFGTDGYSATTRIADSARLPPRRGARSPEELRAVMAGHSHAANIAHRKGIVDAKRGKLFSKLCRAIQVAAKHGGGDPDSNLKLRYAIDKARSYSCPKDNIERSIKKGTGELGADTFEEVIYEGY